MKPHFRIFVTNTGLLRAMIVISMGSVVACGHAKQSEKPKDNFNYWYVDNKTCAKIAGRNYCIDNNTIDSKAWQTDSGPGFLVDAPISDKDLIDCNEKYYKINSNFPNFSLEFHEDIMVPYEKNVKQQHFYKDTRNWYNRRLSWFNNRKNYELLYPREHLVLYGMNCVKASEKSLLGQDFVCHKGTYGDAMPAHFFGCNRDASVPNPSCSDEVYYRDMRLSLNYSKQCAPFHKRIRSIALKFIDDSEVKGKR